jgi:hypothetical protein
MDSADEKPSDGPILEENRNFWRENARTVLTESIKSIEETARQIIVANGILEGLYFHAVTFSNIRGNQITFGILLIYLMPLVLWLISISTAMLVFFPRIYVTNLNSWRDSKDSFENIVAYKHMMLKTSAVFLVTGIIGLVIALTKYLLG